MKLLKELLKETASAGATGGGAVASVAGSLFGARRPARRIVHSGKGKSKIPVIKFHGKPGPLSVKESSLTEFAQAGSQHPSVSPADVISKLTAAEKEQEVGEKSVPFGLEDSEGNIVKVYIKPDQADDFENRLSMILNDPDEEHEIAEILFKIKDDFEIVHVDWGNAIPEDEEEQEKKPAGPAPAQGVPPAEDAAGLDAGGLPGAEGGDPSAAGLPGAEGDPAATGGGEEMMPAPDMGGGEEKLQSTLDKVIDMLMADAEARKAEAQARAKEASAKEAEAATRIANTKVAAEQEVLDMEAWSKRKKDAEKETRKLAQLAKYRHEMSSKKVDDLDDDSVTEL